MALQPVAVMWFLWLANVVFGLLIGVRMAASWGKQPPIHDAPEPMAAAAEAPSIRTWLFLWPTLIVMVAHPLMLLLWSFDPRLVGPALLPNVLPLQIAGIAVMGGGLALITWAYVVFHSFRLLAQIDPGHELCQDGPFAQLRHPIYLAVDLFYLGTFLLVPHLGFLVHLVICILVLDSRARYEEQVLLRAFGDRYARFMAGRRRFVPGVY